jgi:uncharacterized protein (TIRG00374 family)
MILFLYFALKGINIKESINLIYNANIGYVILFFVLFISSHFLRSLRWQIMTKSIKENSKTVNFFGATMIGYGVNCVIPRLGEVYRGLFIGKWEGISRSSMLGTIIIERVIDVIMLVFTVIASLFLYQGDLFKDVIWLKSTIVFALVFSFIFILFIIVFSVWKKEVSEKFIQKLSFISPKIANKTDYIFHTLLAGIASIKGYKNWIYTTILSFIIIFLYAYTTQVGLLMFNFNETKEITFAMAWVISALSSFGVIIPTPGGTGSYHAISIFILVELFTFGKEAAAAYAILTHFISYIVFIGFALFFFFYINLRQKNEGGNTEDFISVLKSSRDSK